MRLARVLAGVALLAGAGFAQQAGDANRDYRINGVGSGAASPVATTAAAPGTLAHAYATLDVGAPCLWAASANVNAGQLQLIASSVDLGTAPAFADVVELGSGLAGGPAGLFFHTGAAGSFSLAFPAPASAAGGNVALMMSHFAATSPDGVWLSQVHRLAFASDPNLAAAQPSCAPAALPLTLGDDSSQVVALGFAMPYFGQTWTSAWVGSNGFVTFGAGDAAVQEGVAAFLLGPPRVAAFWDDLNPAAGGAVSVLLGSGSLEVCFAAVPEFPAAGANSFRVAMAAGAAPSITFDFGPLSATDGLVGLSPGAGLAAGLALNLSVLPNPVGAGEAPYEIFTPASPCDLAGLRVGWQLDASGFPVLAF